MQKYVEDLAKVSRSAGNQTVSGGWTWQGERGGVIVKYNLEENGRDTSFAWLVSDKGAIVPYNDLAREATRADAAK